LDDCVSPLVLNVDHCEVPDPVDGDCVNPFIYVNNAEGGFCDLPDPILIGVSNPTIHQDTIYCPVPLTLQYDHEDLVCRPPIGTCPEPMMWRLGACYPPTAVEYNCIWPFEYNQDTMACDYPEPCVHGSYCDPDLSEYFDSGDDDGLSGVEIGLIVLTIVLCIGLTICGMILCKTNKTLEHLTMEYDELTLENGVKLNTESNTCHSILIIFKWPNTIIFYCRWWITCSKSPHHWLRTCTNRWTTY
jgi:hypothetical protein